MTRRQLSVILTVVAALVAFAAVATMYQREVQQLDAQAARAQSDILVRPHSPSIGSADAAVTIVEFFDPACEACRAFHPDVKQILATHSGKVRLVIRYAPFHRDMSIEGIRVLEAARPQGRFEAVLDALLEQQPLWAKHGASAGVWEVAGRAGLNLDAARSYVASGAVDKTLSQDVADLQAIGIRATPTFLVNGKPLPEASPTALRKTVQREVEQVQRRS